MSVLKSKKDLINAINNVITKQQTKRESKNEFKLKQLGFNVQSLSFLDKKEKKLIDDTIKVLIDFYSENRDIENNPNLIPDNFFNEILDNILMIVK